MPLSFYVWLSAEEKKRLSQPKIQDVAAKVRRFSDTQRPVMRRTKGTAELGKLDGAKMPPLRCAASMIRKDP